jgi:hypothetical protein
MSRAFGSVELTRTSLYRVDYQFKTALDSLSSMYIIRLVVKYRNRYALSRAVVASGNHAVAYINKTN